MAIDWSSITEDTVIIFQDKHEKNQFLTEFEQAGYKVGNLGKAPTDFFDKYDTSCAVFRFVEGELRLYFGQDPLWYKSHDGYITVDYVSICDSGDIEIEQGEIFGLIGV